MTTEPTHVEIQTGVLKCECGVHTVLGKDAMINGLDTVAATPVHECPACHTRWEVPATVDCVRETDASAPARVPTRAMATRYGQRWRKLTDESDQVTTQALAVPGGVLVRTMWQAHPYDESDAAAISTAFVPEAYLMAGPKIVEHIEADPDEGIEAHDQPYREIKLVPFNKISSLIEKKWVQLT